MTLLSVYPPGDPATALHGEFGVGPLNNAHSRNYLLEAPIPSIQQVESSNANPADAQCNSEVAVPYLQDGPPQGSSEYKAWLQVLDPFATFSPKGKSTNSTKAFKWTGSVPPVPGTTNSVTDWVKEAFSFRRT